MKRVLFALLAFFVETDERLLAYHRHERGVAILTGSLGMFLRRSVNRSIPV